MEKKNTTNEYLETKKAVKRMIQYSKEYKLMIKKIELAIESGLIRKDLGEFERLLIETQRNLKECEDDISYWQNWLKQHTH